MKSLFLIIALSISYIYSYAQFEISIHLKIDNIIEITITKDSKIIEIDDVTELNEKGNKINIINDNKNDDCRILLKEAGGEGQVAYKIAFGKFEDILFPDGTIEETFDKNETLTWAKNQIFSLPCEILVWDKTNKIIGERVIKTKNKNGGKPNESDDTRKIFTGIPYYDALSLASCKRIKEKDFLEILNYYNGKTKIIRREDLMPQLKDNPFLYKVLQNKIDQGCYLLDKQSILGFDFKKTFSSVGGLDVTNIADGLAKFLVKRTKEELNVAFFSKFKETLNDGKYADLKVLFPNTWELLDAIGDEIYNYNKYLQNLREVFQSDIKTLDENLPGIINNHEAFFNSHFELAVSLNTASDISKSLKNQINPGEILDNYPLDYLKRKGETEYFNKDWSGAIQTLQLISESLRDSSTNRENYWVNSMKVKEMVNNKDVFKIYLGLLYQTAKNDRYNKIPYEKGSFVDLLDKVKFDADYFAFRSYIINFARKVSELDGMIKNYSNQHNDSIAIENFAMYFKSSVGLIEYCTKVTDLPHFKEILTVNLDQSLKTYFKVANETSDLAIDINRRNYSSAINHTVTIYNLVRTNVLKQELSPDTELKADNKITNKETKALKKYKKASMKLATVSGLPNDTLKKIFEAKFKLPEDTKRNFDSKVKTDQSNDSLNNSRDLLSKIARYGSFMSTVSTAKTSDEIENAIEAAALPAGSSRIKRESPFNVSLNAYTGLFMGHEKITDVEDNSHWINSYGLAAPVGVAISFGAHKFPLFWEKGGHWSYSMFVSLVDIGTIAAFRFQNTDSIAQVPTIQLKDLFSPGFFLSVGIPKSPISFNVGAQVGPNLRSVYVKDKQNPGKYINGYQDNVYLRLSASILVDIPIFNLYTRSK